MAILTLLDHVITTLEKGEYTIGIFLDFSKAFDTVNHEILIAKLEAYGIRGLANKWVKDYLSSRQQFSTINGTVSKTRTVTCGVPQGSILGPLLFLVYINDLASISKEFSMILFADDSNLFMSGKDLADIADRLNRESHKLIDWLRANRLSLNLLKTHYMLFAPKKKTPPPEVDIIIDGTKIERVTTCKFLGVILDENLNWKKHIEYTSTKISKTLGLLNKARKYFDREVLITLYYAFIYPLLLYANIAWGKANSTTLNPLYMVQKRAVRIIVNGRKHDRMTKFFSELNILKLEDISHLSTSVFMFDYHSGKLPPPFKDFFHCQDQTHAHNTRNQRIYRTPFYKTQVGSQFIRKTGIAAWDRCRQLNGNLTPGSRNLVKHLIMKDCMRAYDEK